MNFGVDLFAGQKDTLGWLGVYAMTRSIYGGLPSFSDTQVRYRLTDIDIDIDVDKVIDIEGHRRDSRQRLLGGSSWSRQYPVWTVGRVVRWVHLLSRTSQFFTFDFQSQSWRRTSNAKPPAQRIDARRLVPTSPALSHLF